MSVSRIARQPPAGLVKRIVLGRRLASDRLEHTLLPKILALPVFSSDALSSVAYATEEILLVLFLASASVEVYDLVLPVAIAIALLMAIVVSSYRQTVRAYPSGGGAYIVAKENLGTAPGLVAAAALLVDYVLTVSVSVVAGVFALTSAVPWLLTHRVLLSIAFVSFITLANLRGVRESGTLFAIPTYAFIASVAVMILIGLGRCLGGCPEAAPVPPLESLASGAAAIPLFMVLRAFSSGSTALTGVEAISNGVPAFRRPQARNAAETLLIMGAIAISLFLGISFLASRMHVTVSEDRSVVAQIAHTVFGGGVGFFVVQAFTTAILILAANTSFQDFPRLSAILARDRFLPRQFMNRGDRLVFSNGVVALAVLAGVLIYAFDADLSRLIQLYVVGVFTSFTLSQAGMVRHWLKERHEDDDARGRWRRSIVVNAIGAAATFVVLLVVLVTKFVHGAWIVVTAMPIIVLGFAAVKRHYDFIASRLRRGVAASGEFGSNTVVLLVFDLSAATAEALGYIRSIRPENLVAVHPTSGVLPPDIAWGWSAFGGTVPLEPLRMDHGDLLRAVRSYVAGLHRAPEDFVTVVVPEYVGAQSLLSYLIRRRDLVRLKAGLLREPNVVVTDVPSSWATTGTEARPLIPRRTEVLVFVSAVHDATIRAVTYARSLGAAETRAIYFDLDPDEAHRMGEQWAERDPGIPLDVVEAPFRDLTGPILDEVRRATARGDTICAVVMPEFVLRKWRHMLLHNQNALFLKRLLLFEPHVVLSSVPYPLGEG